MLRHTPILLTPQPESLMGLLCMVVHVVHCNMQLVLAFIQNMM